MRRHLNAPSPRFVRRAAPIVLAAILSAPVSVRAQADPNAGHAAHAAHAAAAPDHSGLHMVMTPARAGTAADSARAARVAATLRAAILRYRDTTAAVADGYRMFLPNVKNQKVYHFTSNWRGMQEAFRFDPARPTSLLYTRGADGRFVLVGAMFTAPRRFGPDRLDARVPLSVARWHRHVNWCVPKRGAAARWLERRDGMPVFGPDSPVATEGACDAVDGVFHEHLFGWMLHANVMAGDDPAVVWGDDHMRHDAAAMLGMEGPVR